jgi:hypothetical protein
MKNEKVPILEYSFCWQFSVEFISEIIRDRGNPSTSSQLNKFEKKKILSKLEENVSNFPRIIQAMNQFHMWVVSQKNIFENFSLLEHIIDTDDHVQFPTGV